MKAGDIVLCIGMEPMYSGKLDVYQTYVVHELSYYVEPEWVYVVKNNAAYPYSVKYFVDVTGLKNKDSLLLKLL